MDGDSEQAADQRSLQGSLSAVLSSQIGPQSPGRASRTLLPIRRGQRERLGAPKNWRCVIFEKLRRVDLVNDSWRTAPNHSRPATCVVEADIDAEDHAERDPQKGH